MPDYVALKVRIGLNAAGMAAYPAFNSLSTVQASGQDWSKYIDRYGEGWFYDKVSGHNDDDVDSPRGQQWGVLLVPKAFADEAVAAFPDVCSTMTEVECQDFHDNRACCHLPDEDRDETLLSALNAELALLNAATATGRNRPKLETRKAVLLEQIDKALDPEDASLGVRKNPLRRFADRKAKRGFKIVQ